MKSYKTEQETFWAGDFGSAYIARNHGEALLATNLAFFSKALRSMRGCDSCIEFGANVGMNLRALRLLYPTMSLSGIEINGDAVAELANVVGPANVLHGSILDVNPPQADLVLIKGVLIHMAPDALDEVYNKLVVTARRWVLVAEYYNPTPVSVPYRDHQDRLFKRDFVGEILDRYPQMNLIDYGFAYRRDPQFPQDDITWFLLEKCEV
jgi:pseudaminic acid biosynthesis-associated methylase